MTGFIGRLAALLSLSMAGVSSTGAAEPQESTSAAVEEHRDLVYLSPGGQDLHLDVFTTAHAGRERRPVWIHVHGGAWWKGVRPDSWRGFSAYLDAGFAIVNVQYRLAGVATAPAAVQDVRCVISWIDEHAERFNFDTGRIVITGSSAGGHLALMAGMLSNDDDIDAPECRDPPRVAAIVDFYGPTDLDSWPAPDPKGGFLQAPHSSIARWIGPRADADVMRQKMSPINYVRDGLPPIFIVHGDADPVVPLQESLNLKQRLDASGARNALHVVAGGMHGKFNDEQQREIQREVLQFLRKEAGL